MQKGLISMHYKLWLLADTSGLITITGWSETTADFTDPSAPAKADHWPTYVLCRDRTQLPARLAELDLSLDAGADLGDFDKGWDVYLRHPDITALRSHLDRHKTAGES
jgi:hypothetical protein